MHILCIKNSSFPGETLLKHWADCHGYYFSLFDSMFEKSPLSIDSYDIVVILGGPQSLKDMATLKNMKAVILMIEQAIALDKFVLGICLGAQLIGETLGCRTLLSPEKEIGFHPITFQKQAFCDPLFDNMTLKILNVFHWHTDMMGINAEAKVLASSQGCPRQVVKFAKKVYGFQSHFEMTDQTLKAMLDTMANHLGEGPHIQDRLTMLSLKENLKQTQDFFLRLLQNIVQKILLKQQEKSA